MRSVRGKVIILVALGLLWAVLFVTHRPTPPARATAQAGSQTARTPAGRSGGFPRLKLEMLTLPRAPYPTDEQDIFGTPPPPPPPPRSAEAARPAPPSPPPDPFQELVKQFRYVGFLRDGKSATAFIVQGQQVLTVAVGEAVAGRFQVTEIGEDFVVLASPAGDKQVRLPLAGEAGAILRPKTPAGLPGPARVEESGAATRSQMPAAGVQPPAGPAGEQNNPGPLPDGRPGPFRTRARIPDQPNQE
ncbi:MAG: hypothetical protein NTW68_20825 [candidate division NC10 bacterium]|nr:hypothetical protein [candidate division NC10 bacterium]